MITNLGEKGYLSLCCDILDSGQDTEDRTGVGTRSVFGRQLRFDLTDSFPLLTTKKLFTKAIIYELLWLLNGDTNIKYLNDNRIHIWDEWADKDGDLGPVYGKQWRSWAGKTELVQDFDKSKTFVFVDCVADTNENVWQAGYEPIDQITNVMNSLRNTPHGRRHLVSAWNPADIDDMKLPPCHCLFQFYVRKMTAAQRGLVMQERGMSPYVQDATDYESFNDLADAMHVMMDDDGLPKYYLDCQLYQRSGDLFLGVPFNIASYSLLTCMMAQQLNMIPGEFVHTFGDVHIYNNHVDAINTQLDRQPLLAPKLELKKADSLFSYSYEDFNFVGYKSHKAIPAPVAV